MSDLPVLGPMAGSSDLLRRHNLGFVLRNVHVAPATRSQLTKLSGLNRSTIAALVAELAVRGLVVEDDASADGQIGRPSPLVRPSDGPIALAVNPEVDAVTVAAVRLGGRVLVTERTPFASAPCVGTAVTATVASARRLVDRIGPGHRIVGCGVALPGIVRPSDGTVRLAPNLGWHDVPLGALLSEQLVLPVSVGNDSALGARAEWVFGAGRGVQDLVYLHGGSSGIGGGIVSAGVLLQGATGRAGEFGHTPVRRRGAPDTAGSPGSLETEAARSLLLAAVGLEDGEADRLGEVLSADRSRDVRAEVHRQVDALAVTIANAVTALNPSLVVLGGFLAALADAAPGRLRRRVEARTLPALHEPVDIRTSQLGPDLLMIGAAELVFSRLFSELVL